MLAFLRKSLPIAVILSSLGYGVGDHLEWWDTLSGRTTVLAVWHRLTFSQGYPKVIIGNEEPCFEVLYKFLSNRTENTIITDLSSKGIRPTAICRLGGTLKPDIGDDIPDWPRFQYALQVTPVAFLYDYTEWGKGLDISQVQRACILGEMKDWVRESKDKERFYVATVLIGLLSFAVVIFEMRKTPKE